MSRSLLRKFVLLSTLLGCASLYFILFYDKDLIELENSNLGQVYGGKWNLWNMAKKTFYGRQTTWQNSKGEEKAKSEVTKEGQNQRRKNSAEREEVVHYDLAPLPYHASADIHVDQLYEEIHFNNLTTYDAYELGFPVTYDRRGVVEREPTLEVIVMPHSQLDPGWHETYESYYFNTSASVYSSAHNYLGRTPDMSFELAEICFLELWWRNHGVEDREALERVLLSGQVEILTGGWVVADEATTHYYALIMQLFEGHEWLRLHLSRSITPLTHWNIDSFGLSPVYAYLLSAAGIRQGVVQRAHYAVKSHLAARRQLNFQWRQAWAGHPEANDFLIHMMPSRSTHITESCGVDPAVCCQFDFARIGCQCHNRWNETTVKAVNEHNLVERADTLADQFRKRAQLYRGNVVFVPWGEDRRYTNEEEWATQHDNLTALFKHINSHPIEYNMHVRFGTAKHYFDLLRQRLSGVAAKHNKSAATESVSTTNTTKKTHKNEEMDHRLPTLSGDFFTYSDQKEYYWSGFYTTRPFHKSMDRTLQHYLRTADILYTAAVNNQRQLSETAKVVQNKEDAPQAKTKATVNENEQHGIKDMNPTMLKLYPRLVEARRALAIFQHHDAVTGTSYDFVMEDHARRLLAAIHTCNDIITRATAALLERIERNERLGNRDPPSDKINESSGGNIENHNPPSNRFTLTIDESYENTKSLARQRVIPAKTSELVLFNPLGFQREQVVCVLVAMANTSEDEESSANGVEAGKRDKKHPIRKLLIHSHMMVDSDDLSVANGNSTRPCNSATTNRKWIPLCHQQLQPVVEVKNGRLTLAGDKQKLCFLATLPALGFSHYYLKDVGNNEDEEGNNRRNMDKEIKRRCVGDSSTVNKVAKVVKVSIKGEVDLEKDAKERPFPIERISSNGTEEGVGLHKLLELANDHVSLGIDMQTGFVKRLAKKEAKHVAGNDEPQVADARRPQNPLKMELSFVSYEPKGSYTIGAYIFLPKREAKPLPQSSFNSYVLIDGPVRKLLVVMVGGPYKLLHIVELDVNSEAAIIRNFVDLSGVSKDVEIVMRLNASSEALPDFYTELNVYQLVRRRRHLDKLPLQAHVFPMTGAIVMQGDQYRLSVLGGQSLGASSLEPGCIDVMLDRRITTSTSIHKMNIHDNRLTESRFRLLVEEFQPRHSHDIEQQRRNNSGSIHKKTTTAYHSLKAHHASLQLQYPVVVQLLKRRLPPTSSLLATIPIHTTSLLSSPLPCDVHLVALRTLSNATRYGNIISPTSTMPNRHSSHNATFVEFTSLRTQPRPAAVLILHRLGVERDLFHETPQHCIPESQVTNRGKSRRWENITVDSVFSRSGDGVLPQPRRVAEASLTLLQVAEKGEAGWDVSELALGPMEVKSWQLEF